MFQWSIGTNVLEVLCMKVQSIFGNFLGFGNEEIRANGPRNCETTL
jgi:hypothetical protein